MPSERRFDFPAQARLKRRADFRRVYREGVRVGGRHVVVFVMAAERREGRLGVTASRRVGGAVVRSRCRRRLRELYRIHRAECGGRAFDVVVNARPGCAAAPWAELEGDYVGSLRLALERAARRQTGTSTTRPS